MTTDRLHITNKAALAALLVVLVVATAPNQAEADQGPAPLRTGVTNVLVPLVNLQDDLAQEQSRQWLETMMFDRTEPESTASWFAEASYGRMQLAGTVLDWSTLPVDSSNCATYLNIQDEAAVQTLVDWLDPDVDFSQIDVLYILGAACPGTCVACGNILGPVSVLTNEGTRELAVARGSVNSGTLRNHAATAVHELGHSFNLAHPHDLECGSKSVGDVDSDCISVRGMVFDCMDRSQLRGHFNAAYKHALGWFTEANVFTLDPQVVGTGTWEIVLEPLESIEDGPQMIRIPIPAYLGPFGTPMGGLFVEYRQPIGFDAIFDQDFSTASSGVLIGLEPETTLGLPILQSHLVDTSPNVGAGPDQSADSQDADLQVGQQFEDRRTGVRIEFVNTTADGAVIRVTLSEPAIFLDGFEGGAQRSDSRGDSPTPD